jgi:outer membrane protein TolC
MSLVHEARRGALLLTLAACGLIGCKGASPQTASVNRNTRGDAVVADFAVASRASQSTTSVARVSYTEPALFEPPKSSLSEAADLDDPFADARELQIGPLLDAIRHRNPSLQASLAAWSAAAERYPQVVALDDPMFQSMFAPASFASSSNVQSSYFVGFAQKVPWPGKRDLRGQMANAETDAASFDSQEVALRLEEAGRLVFADYYLVFRQQELNDANIEALRQLRKTANDKYISNQVTQQDVWQADVELAKRESRRIELNQNRVIAAARINTLLHREPDHPLPPPPVALIASEEIPPVEVLRQVAVERRPELSALASRVQSEQAAVALACKDYFPDVELMGRYDQFWTDNAQRPQIGMYVNVPLNQSRRAAAVREATFRLHKLQAEYDQQLDNVRRDVQAAFARFDAARQNARLYSTTIVPAAQSSLESANAGYVAGRIDFLRLIQAQRDLLDLQEKQQETLAEVHRRQAELDRVVGISNDRRSESVMH